MTNQILVPSLGESVTEATVSKWLKQVGEKVDSDEPLVELEKQIKVVDQDILTFRGAILACNELIEENEQESEDEPVKVVDLDKENTSTLSDLLQGDYSVEIIEVIT